LLGEKEVNSYKAFQTQKLREEVMIQEAEGRKDVRSGD
jgi:hypothetical protein